MNITKNWQRIGSCAYNADSDYDDVFIKLGDASNTLDIVYYSIGGFMLHTVSFGQAVNVFDMPVDTDLSSTANNLYGDDWQVVIPFQYIEDGNLTFLVLFEYDDAVTKPLENENLTDYCDEISSGADTRYQGFMDLFGLM